MASPLLTTPARTGPWLPVVTFLGRLPVAVCRFGTFPLVGLAATVAHPAAALLTAAALTALCGPVFALHRTARAVRGARIIDKCTAGDVFSSVPFPTPKETSCPRVPRPP